ncbi:DUF2851 family protein [Prolixibacter sp. SD074]|jgi:hypothetical protein|uniref:DUF2851 family protein n=1 Tax=Prolixibacter sp. SD074 TaxID=2652391 RepID=UPI00126B0738|nr:DUF2851 family protein [Prolixibacter sp. SD074]GET30859.1 hypothetical protein SD074_30610 [Prolixibacter sp. SD074]
MKEEFLHFIWKHRLYQSRQLKTINGEPIEILQPGIHNLHAGPDFSDARIRIDGTLWVGSVELHRKSSDWKRHGHDKDQAYNNVILHVVAEYDEPVINTLDVELPTLILKWAGAIEENYHELTESKDWVACASRLFRVDPFRVKFFLNGVMIERLKEKSEMVNEILRDTNGDWGETFYRMLARGFGFKENAQPFEMLARSLPQKILAHHHDSLQQTEALLFGQSGLLGEELFADDYYLSLRKEYRFLATKYSLKPIAGHLWKFMRMRPVNFPTIRLAQFARLIYNSQGLLGKLLEARNIDEIRGWFQVVASPYWDMHYHFNRESPVREKKLGEQSFRLLVINVLVPFYFLYGEHQNKLYLKNRALQLLEDLPAEDNMVIRKWKLAGIEADNALESQALLHLKSRYCALKQCLSCGIGHKIILHEPL